MVGEMSEWQSIIGSKKASSYGTCVRSMRQTTAHYEKHYLDKSDTLQGLALKYDCSTDELRRINKLYSSDTIFLREYLLVPSVKVFPSSTSEKKSAPPQPEKKVSETPPESESDAYSFLKQLDSRITAGKNAVKDLKFDESIISSDDRVSSAKYFQNSDIFGSNPRKKHSRNMENNNHFQL